MASTELVNPSLEEIRAYLVQELYGETSGHLREAQAVLHELRRHTARAQNGPPEDAQQLLLRLHTLFEYLRRTLGYLAPPGESEAHRAAGELRTAVISAVTLNNLITTTAQSYIRYTGPWPKRQMAGAPPTSTATPSGFMARVQSLTTTLLTHIQTISSTLTLLVQNISTPEKVGVSFSVTLSPALITSDVSLGFDATYDYQTLGAGSTGAQTP